VASTGKDCHIHVSFGLLRETFNQPDILGSAMFTLFLKSIGLRVWIALYLQSLLSIILIRYSPREAPSAYWCMTLTSVVTAWPESHRPAQAEPSEAKLYEAHRASCGSWLRLHIFEAPSHGLGG